MSDVAAVVERVIATVTAISPRGTATAVLRETRATVSAVARQGQAGPPGVSASAPRVYAIGGVASFTAAHGLPFAPETWVVTPEGERIDTDTLHAPGATTLIFAHPFTGTLYVR